MVDYTAHKFPNDSAKAHEIVALGLDAWRKEQLITQGHHFIQCIFHPCVSFFLYVGVVTLGNGITNPKIQRTKSRVENTTLPFFSVTLMNSAGNSPSSSDFFS
jgi:hypothetical protein